MAVDPTHLTSAYDGVDRATYTTASVSPTANRWLVVDIFNGKATPAAAPTVSGLSLTWVQEISGAVAIGGFDRRQSRFYAWTGSSPGSGTLSLNFSGVTQGNCGWIVYEMGPDVDTSDPFVQSVFQDNSGGVAATSITVTLASFASAGNRPLITVFHGANELSTPEAGYTEVGDVMGASPNMALATAFHPSTADTSPSYSWSTSTATRGAIASEIKAAVEAHSGSASLSQTHTATGTGSKQALAPASLSQPHTAAGMGSAGRSGVAAISQIHSLAATGNTQRSGTAAVTQAHTVTASGEASAPASGTAVISQPQSLTSTGTKATTGSVSVSAAQVADVTGIKAATSLAELELLTTLLASGVKGTSGSVSIEQSHIVLVIGPIYFVPIDRRSTADTPRRATSGVNRRATTGVERRG